MSDFCVLCNLPILDSQKAWFRGWSKGCCIWEHLNCCLETDSNETNSSSSHLSESPKSSTLSDFNVTYNEARLQEIIPEEPSRSNTQTVESFSPTPSIESPMDDPTIMDIPADQNNLQNKTATYQIVQRSSKRQCHQLIDSDGHTYTIQRRLKSSVHWQCTTRPKVNPCKASVIQAVSDGTFKPGKHTHNHTGKVGSDMVAKVRRKVKQEASKNLFKPAEAIVHEVLLEEMGDRPCPAMPKPLLLARAANRMRQRLSFRFKSGNNEHPGDILLNATVEVLTLESRKAAKRLPGLPADASPEAKKNYTRNEYPLSAYKIVGQFNSYGLAKGTISKNLDKVVELRLRILTHQSPNWIIFSEIHILPRNS